MQYYIGTSGYSYSDWQGRFYPDTIKPKDFLTYYSTYFNCVEINMTFYRNPAVKITQSWYKKTPAEFRFVCKASRYITHIQRLKTNMESMEMFFNPLKELKEKLLAVLWQLPPSLKRDTPLIKEFLGLIHQNIYYNKMLHIIEFRHKSWFKDEIFKLLDNYHAGFCWYDAPISRFPKTPLVVTGSTIYLRFHGQKKLYKDKYEKSYLEQWVSKITSKQDGARCCFAFFNNDYEANAVFDALEFKNLFLLKNQ